MRQREDIERDARPLEGQRATRKPYVKPAVRHEQVFETSALSCGKVNATQGQCRIIKKAS